MLLLIVLKKIMSAYSKVSEFGIAKNFFRLSSIAFIFFSINYVARSILNCVYCTHCKHQENMEFFISVKNRSIRQGERKTITTSIETNVYWHRLPKVGPNAKRLRTCFCPANEI